PTGGTPKPFVVGSLQNVIQAAGGAYYALFLLNDGTVWAYGDNRAGQLGDGSQTDQTTPVKVSDLHSVTAIAAASIASLALKSDGTVWAWGKGLLGDGQENISHPTPFQVQNLSGVTAISAAYDGLFMALRSDGTVWMWNN